MSETSSNNAVETHAQRLELLKELRACYRLQIEAEDLRSKAQIAELELRKAAMELEIATIQYMAPNNRYDRSREPHVTKIFAFTAEVLKKTKNGRRREKVPQSRQQGSNGIS
jgi:hypothetical protein